MQLFLKILANSTSYGVYIEMNREEFEQEQEVYINGLDNFSCMNKQVDINGNYYNPLIAVMITGAARLILSMMEKTVYDLGGSFAFCDTDSMSVIDLKNNQPELIGKQVVDKFRTLYPYDDDSKAKGASLLEAEDYNGERKEWNKDTDKQNLSASSYYPLYCFMVSAKRYVLYNLIPDENNNLKIIIRKKSDHGLGHLTSPINGHSKNDWVNDVWKSIICREHNLPYQEPDWFYYPAFAQLSINKPSIYNILNRDKDQDYSKQVKPFNFMLVAYPVEDKIFGYDFISRYYCRLHRAIGLSNCHNKSKCKYSSVCFANLHKIPITPFDNLENWQSFRWLEKSTKEPIAIELSQSKSEAAIARGIEQKLDELSPNIDKSEKKALMKHLVKTAKEAESDYSDDNVLKIKTYYDFIKEYAFHPELKYDDSFGNECGKNTKGLLQRTYIKASEIKHIGKETNTLQDKEEESIIPDESNWDDTILTYSNDNISKPSHSKIDYEQWQELVLILKAKAKPRKTWADNFNITLDYFKQLLAGKRQPSPQLFKMILDKCQKGGLQIPDGTRPMPGAFEDTRTQSYPLTEMALKNGITLEEIKAALQDNIFSLNGNEYVRVDSTSVGKFFSWRKAKNQERKQEEVRAMQDLKVIGKCLTSKKHEVNSFYIEDITHFQVSHEVGRSYKTPNIRLKGGDIFQVLRKDNPLIFKYGLLPKTSTIPFDSDKKTVNKKNGYIIEYGQWQPYEKIPWLNEKQLLSLYGISQKKLNQAIDKNIIPADAVVIINEKIMVKSLIIYQWFLAMAA